jgi:hypothetical protein
MLSTLHLSFCSDRKIIHVTPQTARLLVFRVFDLSPQEKLDLELPSNQWRPCGKGLIDHLHRRCHHDDLSASELSWLDRSLNQLLAKRGYQLFRQEGCLEQLNGAPKHQGFYTQQCGAIFLLEPISKERLSLLENVLIVREVLARQLIFSKYGGVKSHQGKLWFRLEEFFSRADQSITLEDFQRNTRRLFRVLQILPNEQSYFGRGSKHRLMTRITLGQ